MTDYERAPDDQETESIALLYSQAQTTLTYWQEKRTEAERQLDFSGDMVKYWTDQRARLAYQYDVRKGEEGRDQDTEQV